jgi:hypothetical protein
MILAINAKRRKMMFDDILGKKEDKPKKTPACMTAKDAVPFARGIMYKAFKDDQDFKRVYVDNIAMLLYDNQEQEGGHLEFSDKLVRDAIADEIVNFIFGLKKNV